MPNENKPQTEKVLEFKKACLAFLNVFHFPIDEDIGRDELARILRNKGINAVWGLPCSEDFRIAENFLSHERIVREYFRLRLDDLKLSFKKVCETSSLEVPLTSKVFLTVYPKIKIGILLYNTTLSDCNVDDLIFFQHCLFSRFKLFVENDSLKIRGNILFREFTEELIKAILSALDLNVEKPKTLTSLCVEIRGVSNLPVSNPDELIEKFPAQIYGLLVADEGWRYVPPEEAKKRMANKWGTRNFLRVISFGNCVVFINLEDSELFKKYVTSQQIVRSKYGCEVEEYFLLSSEIAGLVHGPLLMLENASVQQFLLEQLLDRMMEIKPKSIKDLLSTREELTDTMAKLARTKIPEIGLLGKNVQEATEIEQSTEKAKEILEDVERALIVKYNQRVNLRVLILTLVSLSIGILSILIQTGLLKQLIEILHI